MTGGRPHSSRPHSSRPHSSRPHSSRPHSSRPHSSRPHSSRPHSSRPHSSRPHSSRPHSSRAFSLANVKSEVFQRDVPVVGKAGTDVISRSDTWLARVLGVSEISLTLLIPVCLKQTCTQCLPLPHSLSIFLFQSLSFKQTVIVTVYYGY